eukprot:365943-Chlamydomonas_euryale.AAC.10
MREEVICYMLNSSPGHAYACMQPICPSADKERYVRSIFVKDHFDAGSKGKLPDTSFFLPVAAAVAPCDTRAGAAAAAGPCTASEPS